MYFDEMVFEKTRFEEQFSPRAEYECCTFKRCEFSGVDLSNCKFIDCDFDECNLSNCKMYDTVFNDARFLRCKMIGLQFESCNSFLLTVSFIECKLTHSSFHGVELKGTLFDKCDLTSTDFTKAGLAGAIFKNSDLLGATFFYTDLEKCDFRLSYNYSIDPEENKIRKAVFDIHGVLGLLAKHDIVIK